MGQNEKNAELAILAKQGDRAALEELWTQNLGLIRLIIRRYPETKRVSYEDLAQSAWFALLNAVHTFDPERGSFNTVFVWCIQKACKEALGLTRKRIEAEISLDTPLSDDADATMLGDMLEDDTLPPAGERLEKDDLRRDMHIALQKLTDTERAIVDARYYKGLTARHAALRLNMTVPSLRQHEEHALKTLRRHSVLFRWYLP